MDGRELVRSASAGSVSGSSALLERHAARIDDLALAMIGDRRTPLDAGAATFVEASVRLSGLRDDDPLWRWLQAVTQRTGALETEPEVPPAGAPSPPPPEADLDLLASTAFPPPSRSLPRPTRGPVPLLVLKMPPPPASAAAVAGPSPIAAHAAAAPSPPSPPVLPHATPVPAATGSRSPAAGGASNGGSDRLAGRRKLLGVTILLLGALLLGLAVRNIAEDEQRTALRSGATPTSTTTSLGPPPLSDGAPPPTDAGSFDPPAVVAPSVDSVPGTAAPASPTSAATTAARPPARSGDLFPTLDTVGLPVTDSTAGTVRGTLPLRNRGAGPLTYTTRSSFPGLTVDKPTGTIAPGTTTQLAVTLDGSKAGEGRFTGTLTFEGSGGTQKVTVTSTVGRPPDIKDAGETCASDAPSCSQLVKLVPGPTPDAAPTPCNTPWRYSVTVEDESQLKAVRADANLAGRDAPLKRDGATRGPGGLWQSEVFPPVTGPATLGFTIEAIDEFDFGRTKPAARTIEC